MKINLSPFFVSLYCVCLLSLFSRCSSDKPETTSSPNSTEKEATIVQDSSAFAQLTFAQPEANFGTVTQGEVVSHSFEFTNTGKTSLKIENAVASCGCTKPEWPSEPIAPGEKGKISVSFNSKNFEGLVKKAVTVTANTLPPTTQVYFTCTIEKKN